MADIAALLVKRDQLIEEISTATALKISADRAAQRAQSELQFVTDARQIAFRRDQLDRAQNASRQQAAIIARLNAQLAEVNAQIAALQRQQAAPKQSTGQTVSNDQTARAEGASTTNPPPVAQTLDANEQVVDIRDLPASNAQRTATSTQPGSPAQDRGLAAPVRKQNQTQSTPATLPEPGPARPSVGGPQPSATPGAAAAGDDVRASINAIFGGERARIVTQPNVLDKYASYSYSISIYLMSPQDYARLVRTKQKNLAGYNLLIQSAGIPVSTGFGSVPGQADVGEVPGVTTRSLDAGRNEYFQEDFYIDDLRIKSVISGKGTAGPHNVVSMDFRITEPNGITLLSRLYKAVQAYVAGSGGTGEQNYAAQNYLMVIRFYGYDVDGNQYLPIKGTYLDEQGQPVTTPTVIEKFIPFQFSAIKFRVADKITEYQCEAVCPQNLIATGPARGVIPYNVEISSKTLKELFSGPVAFSSPSRAGAAAPTGQVTAATPGLGNTFDLIQGITPDPDIDSVATVNSAPPKASAASTPTITQGLADALNDYQKKLVAAKIYEIEDTYRIEILTPALQNSKVVPPGQINQRTVPMGPGSKAPANQQKNPATQSQNKDVKNTSALAGMSIMQFLDQYTRTSTYIYSQQTKIRDPNTQKEIVNGTPAEVTAWYRVGLQAVPKTSAGYDRKRNDYAYDITYQISPYKVNDLQSDYFPQARFQGAHKKYNYWFTGENTQILRFEQDFNYLYYLTINSEQPTQLTGTTSDYREYLKKTFSPRSAQSSMGTEGPVNEPSANAADYLYSPADQGRVKMEIVGDPAWIQQGELWAGIAGAGQAYGPFLDDGTINYEGQEALFEIAFNTPVDYNLDTGVMDPTTNNYNKTATSAGEARQSFVYRAVDVTSMFSQGRFTQELNGVLIIFDLPKSSATAVLPAENESSAETRRLLAAANRGSTTTARITSALGDTPGVDFAGSDFGAYFGTGDTGGAVNYKPTGLAQVLDRQRPQAPSVGALGETPGVGFGGSEFDAFFGSGSTPPAPTPPTSSGQVVGPAASGSAAVRSQGGASGTAVGQPVSVQVFTNSGVVNATSNAEIQSLFSAGRITAQERSLAAQGLAIKQRAATAPVTNQAPQQIAREP